MNHRMHIRPLYFLVFALLFLFHAGSLRAQQTAGQLLAKLEALSPEKREQALIEGAKAEGEVTWYSSFQAVQLEPVARAFNKRYPFIKVNPYRVSGQKQILKIQTEMRAGKHLVDVINGNSEVSYALKEIGALDPYRSPQKEFFPASYRDKEGYFAPTYIIPVITAYNTKLVKPDDVPKTYEDLLQPKWKGKMFLDTEEFPMAFVLLNHFGREKGLQYLKALAKQDLLMVRGRTAQTQQLIAGERELAIALHGHNVLDFKAKGAPVAWTILDPFFSKANELTLARRAPHPHAAALLIDWVLSEEGQSLTTTFGRVVARKGIKQRFPELVEKESLLITPDKIGPTLAKIEAEFRDLFMGGR